MADSITIELNGHPRTVVCGETLGNVLESHVNPSIIAGRVNNRIQPLHAIIEKPCQIHPVQLDTMDGARIYRESLIILLARCVKEVLPHARLHIQNSLSNGFYGELDFERPLVEQDIDDIEMRMQSLVAQDIPFVREYLPRDEALELFAQQGLEDKVRLLKHLDHLCVPVHRLGWYHEYIIGCTVPSTGVLQHFKLRFYLPGFILEFPKTQDPHTLPQYIEQGKLANVYYAAEKWLENLSVHNAAALNDIVKSDKLDELIRICESHHEKQISQIADAITENRDRLRIVLIAGPSSSGKTTFAQRLSTHLRVNGLRPQAISLDNYFVDRDNTPLDEHGNYDFESLEAIDVRMFNHHLTQLIQGETVALPEYNFQRGCREWRGRTLTVSPEQPLVIEGIHGLNDALTTAIPKARKFKIYVSALTQLNVDDHNRIPTTDVRLLRRIIRDHKFRFYQAADTIRQWPSVRRGEEKHIFPFQEDADVMFNSALVYELAVLNDQAENLLSTIDERQAEFSEAQRLLRFLSHFLKPAASDQIPCTSIIREFIGGSCF